MSKSITELLTEAGLFTPQNQEAIKRHSDLVSLVDSLSKLQKIGALIQENFELAVAYTSSAESYKAFFLLDKAKLLTQKKFKQVASDDRNCLLTTLDILNKAKLLTLENYVLAVTHRSPYFLSKWLNFIRGRGILTSNNFVLIATYPELIYLNNTLQPLIEGRIFTQENFYALLAPNHMALVSREAMQLVWDRIPGHLLTQENFQRLIIAAEHANPMDELQRVTDDIIGIVPVMAGAGGPGGGAGMGLFAAPVLATKEDEDEAIVHHCGRTG